MTEQLNMWKVSYLTWEKYKNAAKAARAKTDVWTLNEADLVIGGVDFSTSFL